MLGKLMPESGSGTVRKWKRYFEVGSVEEKGDAGISTGASRFRLLMEELGGQGSLFINKHNFQSSNLNLPEPRCRLREPVVCPRISCRLAMRGRPQ